jgi:hypothetical protein
MRSIRGSAPAEAPCCCAWPATDWRWIRHAGLDRAGVRTAAARPLDPARVAGRRAVRAGRHRRHGRGAAGGLRLPRPRALGGAAGRALHVFGGGHRGAVGRPPGTGRQVDGSGRLRRHHRLAGRHPGLPRRQPLRVRGGHRGLDRGADPGGRGPHGHALRLLPRERALGRDRAGRVAGRGHLGAVVALVSLGLPLFSTSPRVAVATLWLDAALLFSWSEPRRRRARAGGPRCARPCPSRSGCCWWVIPSGHSCASGPTCTSSTRRRHGVAAARFLARTPEPGLHLRRPRAAQGRSAGPVRDAWAGRRRLVPPGLRATPLRFQVAHGCRW